jgi:hypothetical protein
VEHKSLTAYKLSILLQITAESDLLTVVATEVFIRSGEKHNCKKVLLDGRSLTGTPERMERFYYGEFVAEAVMNSIAQGVSAATQFAYILTEAILDPNRFGETVAVNRGLNAKTFETRRDALRWLGIAQASKSVPRKGSAPAVLNNPVKDIAATAQAASLGSLAGSLRRPGRAKREFNPPVQAGAASVHSGLRPPEDPPRNTSS